MNNSSNLSSVRGTSLYQGPGPVEAVTSYHPGQLHTLQTPRTIEEQHVRVGGHQGAHDPPGLSLQMDSRGAVAVANGYHALATRNSRNGDPGQSSSSYATRSRDSRIQPFEAVGVGSGQTSLKNVMNPSQGWYGDGFAARIPNPFDNSFSRDNRENQSLEQSEYTRVERDTERDGQQIESKPLASKQANGLPMSPPLNPPQTKPGQKRNAVGDIKPPLASADMVAPHAPGFDGFVRHRSQSIGSASHENRIAALSMHLRNRLSYAAGKVERSRQSRDAQSKSPLLQGASTSQVNASTGGNNSPEGTTVSAPDPARSPEILPTYTHSHATKSTSQFSPTKFLPIPKLAPPVDIVSSGEGRRRRPNPNELEPPRNRPSFSRRRHHSQQEFGLSNPYSNSRMLPGTPPLRPPTYPTSTPYNAKLQAQSTSMEQDAIETLIFMSSPENSGYRSNARRQNTISNSIDSSMDSNSSATESQNQSYSSLMDCDNGPSASELHTRSNFSGLEAHAGDEIDRMLDQVGDSDSENEEKFASSHFRRRTLPVNSARGLSGL